IALHPARPDRILIGTEGSGIWISTNGGADFFRSSRGMTATRVGALALAGEDVLAAVNHAGPLSGVYVSRDRGRTFTADFAPLPTVLDLAVYAGRAYAATTGGLFERRGNDWHRLPELGTERVEQLLVEEEAPAPAAPASADDAPLAPESRPSPPTPSTQRVPAAHARFLARTPQAIFELEKKGVFVRRPYKHGPPRSAALYDGALWVSDERDLYELTRDANHTVAAPFAGGHLQRLGEQLLLAGAGGAWALPAPGGEWARLTAEPSRVLPTGDGRFGALLLSGEVVRLYDRESRRFRLLKVPVPARDVVAALVLDGRLLLATSGYGVLVHDLAEDRGAAMANTVR
ncbi:MAG TPA: hypothetical protein VHB47_07405, partial [Thermoanaerobaculia bacterium]|nr:hypothetical protein [Thermoanaerobaculia bacterium]